MAMAMAENRNISNITGRSALPFSSREDRPFPA
jgi:hypothetical protein